MIVEYSLAPSDYMAFALYHNAHTPALRKSVRSMRFGIPLLWVAMVLISVALGKPLSGGDVAFLAVAMLWVLLLPAFLRWLVRRNAARYYQRGLVNGQIGMHRVELTDTGLRDFTPVSDWHIAWAAVDGIAEDADRLFVYIGPHAAHIIPKAALGDRLDTFRHVIVHRSAKVTPG